MIYIYIYIVYIYIYIYTYIHTHILKYLQKQKNIYIKFILSEFKTVKNRKLLDIVQSVGM